MTCSETRPQGYKTFLIAQLSTKFQLLIKTKLPTNKEVSWSLRCCIIMLINVGILTFMSSWNCWAYNLGSVFISRLSGLHAVDVEQLFTTDGCCMLGTSRIIYHVYDVLSVSSRWIKNPHVSLEMEAFIANFITQGMV